MATASLASLLDTLTERAASLNAASDSVNTILTTVQQRLVDANVGIEAWLDYPLEATDLDGSLYGETTVTVRLMGFAKVDGHWCFATKQLERVSGFFENDRDCPFTNEYKVDDPTPLIRASREVRIAALEYLPKLIEQLTAATEHCIDSIEGAKALTR